MGLLESNALALEVFPDGHYLGTGRVQRFSFRNWSPTLQLWKLESKALALELAESNASTLEIGVQRFSFGNWSPTLQLWATL
jgi:hypothetical protein